MTEGSVVTLTAEQLSALVGQAVSAALAANKRGPRKPKGAVEELSEDQKAKAAAKAENAEKYLAGKKETAVRLMKERGVHYTVFRKGRKLYIWSDLTVDKTRRSGRSVEESLGTRVYSTIEDHSLAESNTKS